MRDQRSPADIADRADYSVLALLLHEPRLWSPDEIAREVGDEIEAIDVLGRLYGAGLIHRLEGFVFATRAAVRFAALPT